MIAACRYYTKDVYVYGYLASWLLLLLLRRR